ncbi:putative nocturnin [Scophthalmus maximus]|uniref:Nocturnin n=1 Tax=Scophthalmus maximus TaxID=52904 RepID=A0A2U9C7J6_SCOMX|nr:putative nocturnin [Scophthalmus maximus]
MRVSVRLVPLVRGLVGTTNSSFSGALGTVKHESSSSLFRLIEPAVLEGGADGQGPVFTGTSVEPGGTTVLRCGRKTDGSRRDPSAADAERNIRQNGSDRECQHALQRRPARLRRDLVQPGGTAPCCHEHNPSIRVLQWNILAQALGEGKDGFIRCPLDALNWQERKYLILEEIVTHRPDILCLQEVDHFYDTFEPIMTSLGYHGSFLPKPWSPCLDVEQNNGPDGCALFYRSSRFSLQAVSHLRLSAMMLPTNQVAIVQTLGCRATGRRLCVAVTHLKARSGWERLRSAQGADLLQSLRRITSRGGGQSEAASASVPLVVCGDFNAEPSEDVYRRFSSSPLGLNSAYKLLSSDGQTEPAYTTWKIRPSGESCSTLDYIWYSHDALRVDRLLNIPTEEQIGPDRLPSYHYPSDHLSLLCDISFREEPHRLSVTAALDQ